MVSKFLHYNYSSSINSWMIDMKYLFHKCLRLRKQKIPTEVYLKKFSKFYIVDNVKSINNRHIKQLIAC